MEASHLTVAGVAVAGAAVAAATFFQRNRIKRALIRKLLAKQAKNGPDKATMALLKLLLPKNPKLYEFQDLLPPLPLPEVKATIEKWLKSIKPLVSEEQYEITAQKAAAFLEKDAAKLQAWLQERVKTKQNWLEGLWLEFAYLRGRDPIAINVNFFSTGSLRCAVPTTSQAARAAALTYQAVVYKNRLVQQTLKPLLLQGLIPIDMSGYALTFGTTRIPGEEIDVLKAGSPAARDTHIVVLRGSHIYRIPTEVNGEQVSQSSLERAFQEVLDMTTDLWSEPAVAAYTTLPRTEWAQVRTELLQEPTNQASMSIVEDALFAVVLHDETPAGTQLNDVNNILFRSDGQHYWFDKCFNVLVFPNGRCGLNVEHTFADAPVPSHMWEHVLKYETYDHDEKVDDSIKPEHVKFAIPESVMPPGKAALKFQRLSTTVGLRSMVFDTFGKNFPKKCRMSPDGFVQAALQVAALRYFGHPVLTYESASTRMFFHGRTETIRSATEASVGFAKAFVEGKETPEKLKELLKASTRVHSVVSRDAAYGRGVDRHFLGLKLASILSGGSMPELFADKAAQLEYMLSTSQTPLVQEDMKSIPKEKISYGGGFGPVAKNGIGCSYFVLEEELIFHVSVQSDSGDGSEKASQFLTLVEEALKDMQKLFA